MMDRTDALGSRSWNKNLYVAQKACRLWVDSKAVRFRFGRLDVADSVLQPRSRWLAFEKALPSRAFSANGRHPTSSHYHAGSILEQRSKAEHEDGAHEL